MAKPKEKSENSSRKFRPALTPEVEEKQMIALAMDEARRQMAEGTASSQIICHFLKLGSEKEKQELENLKKDIELKDAKIKSLEATQQLEETYERAIKAMQRYRGDEPDEE